MSPQILKKLLLALFEEAWRTASAQRCISNHIPQLPNGRTIVVGAGKASAAMAAVLEPHLPDTAHGLVLTRYGHGCETRRIEILEAAHPVPDDEGLAGARRIVELISDLSADDLVICLISGGGSALLTAPGEGITLANKQAINTQLLQCGAPIDEMNCVRKHLSSIKGGRLAVAAFPARVETLIISDVPGDDPSVIASGPTVGDKTSTEDALAIIKKYGLDIPERVRKFLNSTNAHTPGPNDPRLQNSHIHMIATPSQSLDQACEIARQEGFETINLGDAIEGEARIVAHEHAQMALEIAHQGRRAAIISGGETTVIVRGNGRGGRNAEYGLALAIALKGHPSISAIACDTDGIDGSEDNAGALVYPDTLLKAKKAGLYASTFLENNDAYSFFEALGDLVMTGPTRTNVNDFRAILISPEN